MSCHWRPVRRRQPVRTALRARALCGALALYGLLALAPAPAGAQSDPAAPALTVVVTGVASSDGVLLVALYDQRQAWLKPAQAIRVQRVPPAAARVELRFADLGPGTYAVGVIHDVNRNDKLDFSFFPYPHIEEAAGMSNNPTSRFGPPSFEDSAFVLGPGETRLEIALQK
jgi:uncharacterized protein (DUF2141 family)